MQLMIDDLLSKRDIYENAKMYEVVATLETNIDLASFLLAIEKEQIENAWVEGFKNWNPSKTFEQYYNETFGGNNEQ